MIALADFYHILVAAVPLYFAMILAYISVKWWKLFTPDQCSGINKFVANFSVPLMSFHAISTNNLYHMNLKLLLADSLQKVLALLLSAIFIKLSSRGSLDWLITGFSLATLPNTLVLGIPLLRAMYGDGAANLLSQIVVLQSTVWYTLLLFLFEFRAAKVAAAAAAQLSETTGELEDQGETECHEAEEAKTRPSRNIKTKLILLMVWKKLMRNPNTYTSLVGLIWAAICFRLGIKLPTIVDKSISILSDGGLGMAMFSLGLFMASQSSIIACGARMAALAVGIRFLIGPALMAIPSVAIGLRSVLLNVAIVQAALPQGIVPFVFAKEYNVHPEILSTGVIFGMIIAMPIALAYYMLLGLVIFGMIIAMPIALAYYMLLEL